MLLTASQPVVLDRRTSNPLPPGHYSPGIARVELIIEAEVKKHDLFFKDQDPEIYQAHYELRNHLTQTGVVCEAVAKKLGLSELEIQIHRIGGSTHDVGKTLKACAEIYRLNRSLTPEEYMNLMESHTKGTWNFLEGLKPSVRPRDYGFIEILQQMGLYHHRPLDADGTANIFRCLVVNLGDIFASPQENRHTKGRSQFEAVEIVKEVVESRKDNPSYRPYMEFMERIRDAISGLYGMENALAQPDA